MSVAPSMAEAANIRDVAARHAYVFDNGLSSPDFFDVEKRMASEEFGLIRERCDIDNQILEVGCFTGLNLIGLAELGFYGLCGIDFVQGAVRWMMDESRRRGFGIDGRFLKFPTETFVLWDRVVCFDVLEHQLNVGKFLAGVCNNMSPAGKALFLVPKGREYFDCGHVAFFPDVECLRNVLGYFFDVEECFELASCNKIFAACRKRAE